MEHHPNHPPTPHQAPCRLRLSAVAIAIAIVALTHTTSQAADGGWEYQPYRIHAILAIDAPGGLAEQLAAELPSYLQNRVDAAIAPAWVFDVELATGVDRAQVFDNLASTSSAKPPNLPADKDKLLFLAVEWTPAGFTLTAREYDQYVQRWGVPIRRDCRQLSSLPEQLFALACQAVAPLAQIVVNPDDLKHVSLTPRGAALPKNADMPAWFKTGDVFQPLIRRTSRSGQVVENGVAPVAWTYIEAVDQKDKDDKSPAFRVLSGSRRPFAARKQGRTEQLAIGFRADADDTTLRLRSRRLDTKPLVGYEVLSLNPNDESTTRLGVSDSAGELKIAPGKTRVETLLIKHGGQLLAKLPVVPGAEPLVKVPLPDDDSRLAAEARLAALREDLIDVVARRNILIARAKQKIDKKDYAAAQELLRALDELPGKPQFKLTLDTSQRLLRSDDPQMQRRIDQLFNATQTLMTQFLDLRPITELHDKLREAQSQSTAKTDKT